MSLSLYFTRECIFSQFFSFLQNIRLFEVLCWSSCCRFHPQDASNMLNYVNFLDNQIIAIKRSTFFRLQCKLWTFNWLDIRKRRVAKTNHHHHWDVIFIIALFAVFVLLFFASFSQKTSQGDEEWLKLNVLTIRNTQQTHRRW